MNLAGVHLELDANGPEAAKASETARELMTTRTLFRTGGDEDPAAAAEENRLWNEAISRTVTELLEGDGPGVDLEVVERIAYLVAALSTASAMATWVAGEAMRQAADDDDDRDFVRVALELVARMMAKNEGL